MPKPAATAASIALIAPPQRHAAAAQQLEAALSGWPAAAPRPIITPLPLDASTQTLLLAAAQPFDAAVIAPADAAGSAVLDLIIADLNEALTPTIILADSLGHGLTRLASANVFVRPSADASGLAAALTTLLTRQPAVRALQGQLRIAQSLEGGISAEIERINDELLLAAHVQREFLPKRLPAMPGVDLGVIFRPAGFVSGDMYDLSRLDDHHLGFYIADAMGHGLPAALMTLFIAAHLNLKQPTATGVTLVQPGDALTRLNTALYAARAGPSRFVSAVCGILDTRDGTVTMACAGHPRPIRVGKDGASLVEVSGTLLGILDDSTYEQVTFKLEPGESLILHSDGINAPTREQPEHGLDSPDPDLRGPFEQRALRPAHLRPTVADTLGTVERNLDRRIGSFHQGDDISVVALATADRGPVSPRAYMAGSVRG